jgi:hypothetical protein
VVDSETLSCVLDGVQPATTVFQVKETSAGSGLHLENKIVTLEIFTLLQRE